MPTLRSHLCWIFAVGLSLTLLACTDAAPPDSTYRYVFEEANDTPNALAATLFHALVTGDEALWMKYRATPDEMQTHSRKGRRMSDQNLQSTLETIGRNFADLRDQMRHENGVHGPERIRVLRAYAPYFSAVDSIQGRTIVEYTYQDHYFGAVRFREMVKTDRGWVLAEVARYQDDVKSLVPIGLRRAFTSALNPHTHRGFPLTAGLLF
jgi:hypothetical protein